MEIFLIFVKIFAILLIMTGFCTLCTGIHDKENKSHGVRFIVMGVFLLTGSCLLGSTIKSNTETDNIEEQIVESVTPSVDNTIQTEAVSKTEVDTPISKNNWNSLFMGVVSGFVMLIIVYLVYKNKIEAETEIEKSQIYKNVDDMCNSENQLFSSDIANQNMYKLNELMKCTTGATKEKFQHIYFTVKYLDENDADTKKLHSYYIPELISIFDQSKKIEETTQFGSILKTKQVRVKELQMNAIQTVTDIVNDLLSSCMDKKIDKLQCDTKVMETVSMQDGYKQDFGF